MKRILYAIKYLFVRFFQEGFSYRAAALSYATLLSIVPLTIIGVKMLSFFHIYKGIAARLQTIIIQNFVATSAAIVTKHFDIFLQHAQKLSIWNVCLLFIIAILMIYNINRAFVSAWHSQERMHISLHLIVYLLILVISPLLFGGLLILGTFLLRVPLFSHIIYYPYIYKPFFVIFPYVIIFATFTVCNWILPFCKVRFSHALIGGVITGILFEISKYIFSFYILHFHTYRLLYGALATIPIFLLWLYVAWTIVLFGALITHMIAHGIPKA